MTLIEFDLTVIALCTFLVTVGAIVFFVLSFKAIKQLTLKINSLLEKLEESVDTVNNQLRPAVVELKAAVNTLTETIKVINGAISFVKRVGGRKK